MKDWFKLITWFIVFVLGIAFVKHLFFDDVNIMFLKRILVIFFIALIGAIGTTLEEKK